MDIMYNSAVNEIEKDTLSAIWMRLNEGCRVLSNRVFQPGIEAQR